MSNQQLIAGSNRFETLGVTSGDGTAVTAGNPAGTKGTAVSLGTTSFRYSGFLVNFVGTSAARYRLDILANTGGSDQVIVEDVYLDANPGATSVTFSVDLPVGIPAGAAVKARISSSTASVGARVSLMGFMGAPAADPGFRALKSCTDWSTFEPSNLLNWSASAVGQQPWVTLCNSTPARIAGLFLFPTMAGLSTSRTASRMTLDVGWGAAGSEQVLFGGIEMSLAAGGPAYLDIGMVPCDLPAGIRLAWRTYLVTTQANATGFGMSAAGAAVGSA